MKDYDELTLFLENTKNCPTHIFEYSGEQKGVKLYPGIYSFECWGAAGFPFNEKGNFVPSGNGSYVFGKIRIDSPRTLYISVGEHPVKKGQSVFGGGGLGDYPGGGSTDIRLIPGDSFESLKSRIIIAAAGGGADSMEGGGSGGGLIGKNTAKQNSKGANQTAPGTGYYNGDFGKGGGIAYNQNKDGTAGGGSGYYGGGSGILIKNGGGSGGSSFISGHPGCDSICSDSQETSPYCHTGNPWHYSGFVFFDTIMLDGDSKMPAINKEYQIGNTGHGYIRIKKLSSVFVLINTNLISSPKTHFLYIILIQLNHET